MRKPCLFVSILVLMSFCSVSLYLLFSQTYTETFYMRANGPGSAPETIAGAWDLADVNTASNWDSDDQDDGKLGPNDRLIVLDDDGIIRGTFEAQNSGLSGKPITIQGESGTQPQIFSSVEVTGFSQYSGSIYRASFGCSPEARPVYFVETGGDIVRGTRKTSTSLTAEYDYYHDQSPTCYIYVHSGSKGDPDTGYSRVEAAQDYDVFLIDNGYDYITVENLELGFAGYTNGAGTARPGCFHIHSSGSSNIILQDSYTHDCGDSEVEYGHNVRITGSNHIIRRNTIESSARHGVSNLASSGNSINHIVEENWFKGGEHTLGVDTQLEGTGTHSGHIFRYNKIERGDASTSIQAGFFFEGYDASNTIDDVEIYGNIIEDLGPTTYAIHIKSYVGTIKIYNNTISIDTGKGIWRRPNAGAGTLYIKNNIVLTQNAVAFDFDTLSNMSGDTVNFNSLYRVESGDVVTTSGGNYTTWAAYNSGTGFDANGTHSGNDFVDPGMTNPGGGDFTLSSTSVCIDVATNLGTAYDDGLDPSSTWPGSVTLLDQDLNGKPNQATQNTPLDEATNVSVNPTLTSLAYGNSSSWDIGAFIRKGQSHTASQWQIDDDGGDWSTPVYDSGEDASNLTSIATSAGLTINTPYDWRVRHKNEHGWGSWAAKFDFTTETQVPPAPPAELVIGGAGAIAIEYGSGGMIFQ